MNRTLALLIGVGLSLSLVDKPMVAQSPPQPSNFQRQLKHGFNQAKNRVSQLFVRPQKNHMSSNRRTHPAQNQHYQQATQPHRQPMHRYPLASPQTMQHNGQPVHHGHQIQHAQPNDATYPNPDMAAQAGYLQQPQPDLNTQGPEPAFQEQPQDTRYRQETVPSSQLPPNDPRSIAPSNPGPPMQNAADGWSTQSKSNYQNYLRSGAAIANKPPTMDYYNERQFRHFSDRISATERAIILEDELANAREDKRTLESKIRSLEAQLKQRDFEIEQLQSAVNDAIEQLSTASSRHSQLQEQNRMITTQRNQERAAYEKLLDELRQQLNELLANELIGTG